MNKKKIYNNKKGPKKIEKNAKELEFYSKIQSSNRAGLVKYLSNYLLTRKKILSYVKKISFIKKIPISKVLKMFVGTSWKNRIFMIPTEGIILKIINIIKRCKPKKILELFAGHGLMSHAITENIPEYQDNYIATDDFSYGFDKKSLFYPVQKMKYKEALKKYADKDTLIIIFYQGGLLHDIIPEISKYKVNNIFWAGWKSAISNMFIKPKQNNYRKVRIKIKNNDLLVSWDVINRSPFGQKFMENLNKTNHNTDVCLFKKIK